MTKVQVVVVSHGELMLVGLCGILALFEVTETVEGGGPAHAIIVLKNGGRGHGEMCALWQLGSIREGQVGLNDAVKGQRDWAG